MVTIALNLCHIHISPLIRRRTTTETSTHLSVGTSGSNDLVRCGSHHTNFQGRNNTLPSGTMSTNLEAHEILEFVGDHRYQLPANEALRDFATFPQLLLLDNS